MLERMSSREYAEWQAYYEHEAFGPLVQEIQLAKLSYLVAQAWFANEKKGVKFDPRDFLVTPNLTQVRPKQQTWQQQLELVRMIAKATGTKITSSNN